MLRNTCHIYIPLFDLARVSVWLLVKKASASWKDLRGSHDSLTVHSDACPGLRLLRVNGSWLPGALMSNIVMRTKRAEFFVFMVCCLHRKCCPALVTVIMTAYFMPQVLPIAQYPQRRSMAAPYAEHAFLLGLGNARAHVFLSTTISHSRSFYQLLHPALSVTHCCSFWW